MQIVRSQHGLAYSIGSSFDVGKFPGSFKVVLQTKNRSANEALKLVLEQIEKVERGEDPMGVVRDRAKNEPYISIAREGVALRAFDIQRELTRAADREIAAAERA